ncbi:MAG: hypothetical protein JWL96_1570 [Sphingomonas bacterium]|uniref:glycerophosphoryl diester phosphodiesterase membrane domain-containing protein n=1 Tax=Sphingomonas bacterium TaxID=1895847 RepID=UPI0026148D37|nr:glycerophosphoryl diester phosphodiesterase membrane domain-containing protein [Sphingomonas bacterium]MDB5709500.1 hypothetical protein [Sphingomonas bacterium]
MVVIGSVWDRTVEFISDNLSAVVPIALMGIFVPLSIYTSLAPLASSVAPAERSVIYGVMIVLGLWSLWGKLAITALALDPHAGRAGATQMAGRRLLPAIGISLGLLAILLLATAPVGIALQLAGFDFAAAASGHAALPGDGVRDFIVLYALLLGTIVLWIAARLSVLLPTIVMERRGLGALRRSFRLTRGFTWKILGVVLLYVIVAFVAEKATQFVFGTILGLLFGNESPVSLATILTSILVGVVATGFTVLAAAFCAKLYLALRDARESIVNAR